MTRKVSSNAEFKIVFMGHTIKLCNLGVHCPLDIEGNAILVRARRDKVLSFVSQKRSRLRIVYLESGCRDREWNGSVPLMIPERDRTMSQDSVGSREIRPIVQIFRQCAASILDSVCRGVQMSGCPSGCKNNFSPVRLYSLNLPPDARVAPGSCTVQYKQLIISVSLSVQRLE
jgi:hypothetical protein